MRVARAKSEIVILGEFQRRKSAKNHLAIGIRECSKIVPFRG